MKKFILVSAVFALALSSCCNKNNSGTCGAAMPADTDSLRMTVRVPAKVKPEFVSAFKAASAIAAAASLAEDGCLEYELYQSPTDSTLFFLDEVWVNKYAHSNHMTLDHFKTYVSAIKEMKEPNQPRDAEEIKICPIANAKK